MTYTNVQEPHLPLESPQNLDIESPTVATQPCGSHVIRGTKKEHYIHFASKCQLLTFYLREKPTSRIEISFSASRLLELLILRADTIVAREDILAYAWPGRVVTQSSLNQAISGIREQLGDETAKEIIQTMPRRGYQFNSRFLISPSEWPVLQHDINLAATVVAPPPCATELSIKCNARRLRIPLLILAATLFAALIWRFNYTLFMQPGLVTSNQYIGNQSILYTAPDKKQLVTLQADVMHLRDRLVSRSESPSTLLFNRMHNFLDVICINQSGEVFSMLVHQSQLSKITDHHLLACVK